MARHKSGGGDDGRRGGYSMSDWLEDNGQAVGYVMGVLFIIVVVVGVVRDIIGLF